MTNPPPPPGSSGRTGPTSAHHPPRGASDPARNPKSTIAGRRRIRQHQASKNVPQPNGNPHPPQQTGKGLPTRDANLPPGALPSQSGLNPINPDPSYEEAKNQLKSVIDEFWVRDQLELMMKIVDNPQLADALGCVIKVKLPNTTEAVQVYPLTGEIGPDHLERYLQPLKGSAQKALQNKQKSIPDHQLYSMYVLHRSKVFELGRAEAHSKGQLFEYSEVFQPMLYGNITKDLFDGGATFKLTREDPDPRHAERLNKMRGQINSGHSKRKIMAPKAKPHPNPKHKAALNKPGIDLRIGASREDIDRSRAAMAERRALSDPNIPQPPSAPTATPPTPPTGVQ